MTVLVSRSELGQRIVQAQEAAGYKNPAVAAALEVDVRTISRWRNGYTRPGYDHLQALARLFSVSMSYFLD